MSGAKDIQRLLERGLYHYGIGDTQKALERWREVLRYDPSNETAREYIEIETGRKAESSLSDRSEPIELAEVVEEETTTSVKSGFNKQFVKGYKSLHRGDWLEAIQSFEAAHKLDPSQPYYWAHVELCRAGLLRHVIEACGGRKATPRLKVPLTKLIGTMDFTQEEGFVLSLITGETTVEDLAALSPLPRFMTFRILYRLLSEELLDSRSVKKP